MILVGLVVSLRSSKFTQRWDFVTKIPDSFVFLGSVINSTIKATKFIYYLNCRIASLISQTTILILTILKYVSARRGGWARIPIMKLMIRDGSLAFGFLLGEFMCISFCPI